MRRQRERVRKECQEIGDEDATIRSSQVKECDGHEASVACSPIPKATDAVSCSQI